MNFAHKYCLALNLDEKWHFGLIITKACFQTPSLYYCKVQGCLAASASVVISACVKASGVAVKEKQHESDIQPVSPDVLWKDWSLRSSQ